MYEPQTADLNDLFFNQADMVVVFAFYLEILLKLH